MDLVSAPQLAGIGMVFLGGWILSFCSKMERKKQEKWKDPRARYGRRKTDIVKPNSAKGTILTLVGTMISLGGMILIMVNIKM